VSYDGGLGALVSEIKQASENITQADANNARRLESIEGSINDLYRKVGRPGAEGGRDDVTFERKDATEMCKSRHANTVKKVEEVDYSPSGAEVDEAIAAQRGLKAYLRTRVRQAMIAPRRGHSPQPNGIHARIERVAGPVGIARESSKKFRGIPFQLFQLTYWGAQVSKKSIAPISRRGRGTEEQRGAKRLSFSRPDPRLRFGLATPLQLRPKCREPQPKLGQTPALPSKPRHRHRLPS
jgi:hypothetical protein